MDPLSITASVITLIQAANEVVSLCYSYTTAAKGSNRSVSGITDEVKSLRNILESLEQLVRRDTYVKSTSSSQLQTIKNLCDGEAGPIAKELKYLDEKLRPPAWASRDGSRRKAILQALIWPLKEEETKKTLTNIERLKASLELALNIEQT